MDTKLIEWAKTILLTHTITPRLLSAITKENEKMLSLGLGSRHFEQGMNTYDFLDNMLRKNILKRNLRELYSDVEDILSDMNEEERRILKERFLMRKSISDTMPSLNIRTAYRRYNGALNAFALRLLDMGYSVEVLEDRFASDKVISAILRKVKTHSIIFKSENKEQDVPSRPLDIGIKSPLMDTLRSVRKEERLRA